jgi:hypothetical protein
MPSIEWFDTIQDTTLNRSPSESVRKHLKKFPGVVFGTWSGKELENLKESVLFYYYMKKAYFVTN